MKGRLHRRDIPREEIIAACNRFHARQAKTPDVELSSKYPPKLILARMQQMVDEGLLEYGTSLRGAWVETIPRKVKHEQRKAISNEQGTEG